MTHSGNDAALAIPDRFCTPHHTRNKQARSWSASSLTTFSGCAPSHHWQQRIVLSGSEAHRQSAAHLFGDGEPDLAARGAAEEQQVLPRHARRHRRLPQALSPSAASSTRSVPTADMQHNGGGGDLSGHAAHIIIMIGTRGAAASARGGSVRRAERACCRTTPSASPWPPPWPPTAPRSQPRPTPGRAPARPSARRGPPCVSEAGPRGTDGRAERYLDGPEDGGEGPGEGGEEGEEEGREDHGQGIFELGPRRRKCQRPGMSSEMEPAVTLESTRSSLCRHGRQHGQVRVAGMTRTSWLGWRKRDDLRRRSEVRVEDYLQRHAARVSKRENAHSWQVRLVLSIFWRCFCLCCAHSSRILCVCPRASMVVAAREQNNSQQTSTAQHNMPLGCMGRPGPHPTPRFPKQSTRIPSRERTCPGSAKTKNPAAHDSMRYGSPIRHGWASFSRSHQPPCTPAPIQPRPSPSSSPSSSSSSCPPFISLPRTHTQQCPYHHHTDTAAPLHPHPHSQPTAHEHCWHQACMYEAEQRTLARRHSVRRLSRRGTPSTRLPPA